MPDQILRVADLAALLSVSRTTVWRWTQSGHLPPPLKIGPHTTGWRSSVVEAWLDARASE